MKDAWHLIPAEVVQDCLDLAFGRRGLDDVELELFAARLRLCGVIACLVFGRTRGCRSVDLLEEGGDSHRGRGAGLVEEGDDIESFRLRQC